MQAIKQFFKKYCTLEHFSDKQPSLTQETETIRLTPGVSLEVARHMNENSIYLCGTNGPELYTTRLRGPAIETRKDWCWADRVGDKLTSNQVRVGEMAGQGLRRGLYLLQSDATPDTLEMMQVVAAESARFLADANALSQAHTSSSYAVSKSIPPGERLIERSQAVSLALMAIAFSRYFADATLIAGLPLNAALNGIASEGDYVRLGAQVGWLCAVAARAEIEHLPRGQRCRVTIVLDVGRKTTCTYSDPDPRKRSSLSTTEHTQYADLSVKIEHVDTNAIIREYPLTYEPPRTWFEGERPPEPRTIIVSPEQVRDKNFCRVAGGVFASGSPISTNLLPKIKNA
ncbi:MAG: hypothetical protein EOO38_16925 [Cytophagaceae bacterium]|nr:MAG: hypothetical protein EOO38_16925 [Cytophagaceae bacterium]